MPPSRALRRATGYRTPIALRDGLLTVPGIPEVEVPDLRDSCDIVGFSHSSALGVTRDGLGQYLDGYLALQLRVGGPIHLAHAAHTNLGSHFVRTESSAGCERQAR